MAITAIPSGGLSTAVASSLTTIMTASGKQRVFVYVSNPTAADIDLSLRTGSASGATEVITILAKKKQLVYEGVQPNGGIVQLGGSTSLVYDGYSMDVA